MALTQWIKIGGSGAAGPAGVSGGGAAPSAPNLVSATAVVSYGLYGNASAYKFSGIVNLPTTDPNYSHLKKILVEWTHGSVTVPLTVLTGPWASSPQNWTSGVNFDFLQDASSHTDTITFVAENEDGVITASPITVSVTIEAAAVNSISSPSEIGPQVADPNTRLVSTTLSCVPVLNGTQVPQNVTFLVSQDGGATWVYTGWTLISSSGQAITVSKISPVTAATNWKFAACIGAVGGDPTIYVPSAGLSAAFPGVVISSAFSVAGLTLPAATAVTGAAVGSFSNRTRANNTQYGEIGPVTYTDPTDLSFFVRVTVELHSSSGILVAEQPFSGFNVAGAGGGAESTGVYDFDYLPSLSFVRYRIYLSNRASQGTYDFQSSTLAQLQTTCWSGADHADVSVTLPAVTSITSASEIGPQVADPNTRLVSTTLSAVPVLNELPQVVTFLVSQDNKATWVYTGSALIITSGQAITVTKVSPLTAATNWAFAMCSGAPSGNPTIAVPNASLAALFPGVVTSSTFSVAGLAKPATTGVTGATVGSFANVVRVDGTQYGHIGAVSYTDPTDLSFFVRVTVENLDASLASLVPEQPFSGFNVFGAGGTVRTTDALDLDYIANLAFIRYRIYTFSRASSGTYDFTDPTIASLQTCWAGSADHADVAITIPPNGIVPSLGALKSSFSGALAQLGVPYHGSFATVGGVPPYSYAVTTGSLPAGLSISSSTGAITGTPSLFLFSTFTVTVTDHAGTTVAVVCKITVSTASSPVDTTTITSCSAFEVGGSRHIEPDYTTHCLIEVEPTWAGSYGQQSITIWLFFRRTSGSTPAWYWATTTNVLASGTAIAAFLDVFIVNGSSVAGQVAVLPGSYPGDSTVPLLLTDLPTGYTLSSTFPLYLTNPLATGLTSVSISGPTNEGINADGLVTFDLTLTATTPGQGDPNVWFYQSTVQWQDASGSPDPGGNGQKTGEQPWATINNDGTTSTIDLPGNYSSSPTYDYLRIKIYGISRNGTANPNFTDATAIAQSCFSGSTSAAVLVSLSVVTVPPVTNFAAGQSNGNGTFAPVMYWDDLISALHVDFGFLAPSVLTNWSGVAVWAKAPSTSDPTGFVYTQLTDIYSAAQFTTSTGVSGTEEVLFDTIAIALASVPSSPQSWIFIATSYDHQGNRANDLSGAPTGPTVTLLTLANQTMPVKDGQLNLHTANPSTVGDNLGVSNDQLNVIVGAGLTSVANAIAVNATGALNTIGSTLNLTVGPALSQIGNQLAVLTSSTVSVINNLLDILPGSIGPAQISTVNATQINSLSQTFTTFLGSSTVNASQVTNLTSTITTLIGSATFTVGQVTNFTSSVTSLVGTLNISATNVTGLTSTINTLIGSATFTIGQVTNFTSSVQNLIGTSTFNVGQINNFNASVATLVGTLIINVSNVSGVFNLNIGNFAGTLNVGSQIANGSITSAKIGSVNANSITAGLITGVDLVIQAGTILINIDGSNFIKVQNTSVGEYVQIFYSEIVSASSGSGNSCLINPFGISQSGPSTGFSLGGSGFGTIDGGTAYTGTLAAAISAGKSVVGGIIKN